MHEPRDILPVYYVFPEPVEFTIAYDPTQINGLAPETLRLFYWDVDTQQWSQDGLTFVGNDTVNHTITYRVAHFTEFSYFGNAPAASQALYLPLISRRDAFYSNNFTAGSTAGWSATTLSTAPNGEAFLGEFSDTAVRLTLSGMPAHSRVTVSFDLYILRTWDGNQVEIPDDPALLTWYGTLIAGLGDGTVPLAMDGLVGADRWQFAADGATLVDTTFANIPNFRQSYPDGYPAGDHAAQTGAVAVNRLGYRVGGTPMDAVYTITRSFDHSGASLTLDFTALGLQGLADESWGLDNVVVLVE